MAGPVEVRVRVTNEHTVAVRFYRMGTAAADMRPVWRRFARKVAEQNAQAFATMGAGVYRTWAPLSAKYAAWKAIHYPGMTTLIASGHMERAMTSPGRLLQYSGRAVARIEVQDPIYTYHHFGTRHMPARRVMVMTKKLKGELASEVGDHIVRAGRPGPRL